MPAEAVIINVGGTPYDVVFFANPLSVGQPSFNNNQASLTSTPWWADATLASDFATAYVAQAPAGSFNFSGSSDGLLFAHAVSGDTVSAFVLLENGSIVAVSPSASSNFGNRVYAYTAPLPVPEIDGNALAKALFVLFTLGVWLQLRRNRRAA